MVTEMINIGSTVSKPKVKSVAKYSRTCSRNRTLVHIPVPTLDQIYTSFDIRRIQVLLIKLFYQ